MLSNCYCGGAIIEIEENQLTPVLCGDIFCGSSGINKIDLEKENKYLADELSKGFKLGPFCERLY